MHQLISDENAGKKKDPINWNPECEHSFLKLKELFSWMPVLAYVDYFQPFQLHTDASKIGLGAVLYQDDDDGKRRVVVFASHSLSHSEKQYPAHKLEFLTLKWAITDRYDEYLYGGTFDIYTNNNPLTYILTTA